VQIGHRHRHRAERVLGEKAQLTDCTVEAIRTKQRNRQEEWALVVVGVGAYWERGGGEVRKAGGCERFHLKRKAAWTWVMLAAENQYYAFSLPASQG
jgi:hypothetical protein